MEEQLPHSLHLSDRKKLTVTGVSQIVSFDETAVVMQTHLGTLVVQGQDLQLKTLATDGGQAAVEGNLSALIYEEPRQRPWGRLFH